MTSRLFAGVLLAAAISLVARRARSLSNGGAAVATIVGTVAVAAGWNWGALLIIYFASSSMLSHVGREQKELRTKAIVAKSGERDAVQVLANGAMFAGAALAMLVHPHVRWIGLGAGSLAASAADTWATEVGILSRADPRSILTWRRVPAGTSGGVSVVGTIAMFAGAAFIAAVVAMLGWTPRVASRVAIGGVVGALVDSVLGATLQSRRWCDACAAETERLVHDCGTATRRARGLPWLDNDIVNFLAAMAGGLLAASLSG